jgi:hypothetical protein
VAGLVLDGLRFGGVLGMDAIAASVTEVIRHASFSMADDSDGAQP